MSWSLWIITAVILFVVEIAGPGVFFFACLGIGALASGLVELLLPPFWVQWAVFIFISFISMYFIRPIAKKYFKNAGSRKTNVDALIGQKAWVTESINPSKMGMVKIEGELWKAEAEESIEAGVWVEVVKVDGTHLKVKKI